MSVEYGDVAVAAQREMDSRAQAEDTCAYYVDRVVITWFVVVRLFYFRFGVQFRDLMVPRDGL